MRNSLLAALAVLLIPLAAAAGRKALDVETIVLQQNQIKTEVLARKGHYADMPERDRDTLLRKQQQLLAMLEGKQSTNELSEAHRVEAFNTLEWIEAAISKKPEERMVCVREKTIGSNRMTRTCRTESQWAEARERAREKLMSGGACSDLGGVSCSGD